MRAVHLALWFISAVVASQPPSSQSAALQPDDAEFSAGAQSALSIAESVSVAELHETNERARTSTPTSLGGCDLDGLCLSEDELRDAIRKWCDYFDKFVKNAPGYLDKNKMKRCPSENRDTWLNTEAMANSDPGSGLSTHVSGDIKVKDSSWTRSQKVIQVVTCVGRSASYTGFPSASSYKKTGLPLLQAGAGHWPYPLKPIDFVVLVETASQCWKKDGQWKEPTNDGKVESMGKAIQDKTGLLGLGAMAMPFTFVPPDEAAIYKAAMKRRASGSMLKGLFDPSKK